MLHVRVSSIADSKKGFDPSIQLIHAPNWKLRLRTNGVRNARLSTRKKKYRYQPPIFQNGVIIKYHNIRYHKL